MLAEERYRLILDILSMKETVTVEELVKSTSVSAETIRRDLILLHKKNKLKKIHGGATRIKRTVFEPSYNERSGINRKEKEHIGKIAASFIEDNDIIAIDIGTTALEVARNICNVKNITVITNSINVLVILIERRAKGVFTGNIIAVGGVVDEQHLITTGSVATSQLMKYHFDKVFIGVSGIDENNIMTFNLDEGSAQEIMVANSEKVFALADSTKFMRLSLYSICKLEEVDYLITEKCKMPSKLIKALNKASVNWVC